MNSPASLLLPPDGRVFLAPRPSSGPDILVLPVMPGSRPGGDGLMPALEAILPSGEAAQLLARRDRFRISLAPLQATDMDDAMRRIRPANTLLLEWPEAWAVALANHFADSEARELCVPRWAQLDAPSLRIVIHAWLRAAWRRGAGRPLDLRLTLPPGLPLTFPQWSQARHTLACLGLPAAALSGTAPQPVASTLAGSVAAAATAFIERNYAAVGPLLAEAQDFPARALRALVLARTSSIHETAAAWNAIAADRALPEWERASACSSVAVCWAKELTAAGFAEAERAIARGRAMLDGGGGGEAAHIRGWLWNNAGLVAVLRHAASGAPDELRRAEECLAGALGEAAATAEREFPNLHHNLVANAVQLLELRGQFAAAARVLAGRFGGGDSPVYHFRRAGLLARAGEAPLAHASWEAAAAACPAHAWFFREVIEHALGCLKLQAGAADEAAAHFRRGLELCGPAGLRAGVARHAAGLRAAAPGDSATARWPVAAGGSSVPRPLPKLPPFLPELDLCAHVGPSANAALAAAARVVRPAGAA